MHRFRRAVAAAALLLIATAACVAAQTTVILVRHAEKAAEPADNPPLTPEGQARAQRLAEYLRDAGVDAIYSTPYARTTETAKPLADRIGVPITPAPLQGGIAASARELATRLRNHRNQTVLVVGHSNTIGPVIEALGAPKISPIADEDYENLFIVVIAADGTASLVRARF